MGISVEREVSVRRVKRGLPINFRAHPNGAEILAECDIGVTPSARLAAKLVVFETPAALKRFWRSALDSGLGRGCVGAVNSLCYTRTHPRQNTKVVEVDPRYFCIIGLCVSRLDMEVICHEATHAGFYYARRHHETFWRKRGTHDSPDEEVCYPVGRIAASINRFLHKKGLYR